MVELQLQPLDADTLQSKDTYVSVRIGDAQKLSRANQLRHFKFSASNVGDRKFGKLEIFKRVGGCAIGLTAHSDQELSVPLDDNSRINFKAFFKNAPAMGVLPTTKEDKVETGAKVQAAKAYLDKHDLEMRLSEAMQTVLRERPEDPGAFIANRLMKSADTVKYVPKKPTTSLVEYAALAMTASTGELEAALSGLSKSNLAKLGNVLSPAVKEPVLSAALKGKTAEDVEAAKQRARDALSAALMDDEEDAKTLGEYIASASVASLADLEAALSSLSGGDRQRLQAAVGTKGDCPPPKFLTLDEIAALVGSANSADTEAVLSGLSADAKGKVKDALISLRVAAPSKKTLTVDEIAALVGSATSADTEAVLSGLSADAKGKVKDALISLRADAPKSATSQPSKTSSDMSEGKREENKMLTLSDIAALVTSAAVGDIEPVIASFSAGAKGKLNDALIALNTDASIGTTPPPSKTLTEIAALVTSAAVVDIEPVIASFSPDTYRKINNALLALIGDVSKDASPSIKSLTDIAARVASSAVADIEPIIASLNADVKRKVKDALLAFTLRDIAALVTSAAVVDIELVISGLNAIAMRKLNDALV